ncbi:MAG: dihydroorotase [bacterium]
MGLLIKGGRVIDPFQGIDGNYDILILKDRISMIDKNIEPSRAQGCDFIEASGKIVCPGLIDMHTHLREPGREDKETIATGCAAAVAGGFTSIACMPNTNPVNDNASVTKFILDTAAKTGKCHVLPIGSISQSLKGEYLSEIGELKHAGSVALSDDGEPVQNADLMRRAMEYASMFNLTVISHCEERDLSAHGVMNEGYVSTLLGLKGIPNAAEEVMVAREISLCRLTNSPVHIAHVSTEESVNLIRQAKKEGLRITAEVTPHHLFFTDEIVKNFDTNTKVNPPLRTQRDIDALIKGLKDGTIDVIVTDHAPHTKADKEVEYSDAPFGLIGLETALPVIITRLYYQAHLDLKDIIEKMTINPAQILRLPYKGLVPGQLADITIIDPQRGKIVDVEKFHSKARNCPFHGLNLKGWPVMTIFEGTIVYRE